MLKIFNSHIDRPVVITSHILISSNGIRLLKDVYNKTGHTSTAKSMALNGL